MRRTVIKAFIRFVGVIALIVSSATPAPAAIISTFTGGDSGEGLDLEGTFYVAVDIGGSGGAVIEQGEYCVDVSPGTKRVVILAYRKVGETHVVPNDPSSPTVDILEQILPEQYNAKSTLTCQIRPGATTQDFAVQ